MPWLIGIDEAGYGPNLGPFVMTAAACRVDHDLLTANLWDVLRAAVRRPTAPADGRLLVEDSKQVYTPKDGLARLEVGVLATMNGCAATPAPDLAAYLGLIAGADAAAVAAEPWYQGVTPLPHAAPRAEVTAAAKLFDRVCGGAGVGWARPRSVVVCAPRFNQLLNHWGTKGAVLSHGLAELLRTCLSLEGDEPLVLYVDKHGGRNTYAAMLQDAVPEGLVVAHEEAALRSVYSIRGLGREVRITVQPRADAEHFCVALASMASKYLRELLMHEFNGFWRRHVPDLQPTAGYPTDAKRFHAAIRPAMERLGLAEDTVWRRK